MQVSYKKDSNIPGRTIVSIDGKPVGSIQKEDSGKFLILDARNQKRIPGYKSLSDAKKHFEKESPGLRRP